VTKYKTGKYIHTTPYTLTQQYKLWSSRPRPLKACNKNQTLEWER